MTKLSWRLFYVSLLPAISVAAIVIPSAHAAIARWHVPAGALVSVERRAITLTNNGNIVVKVNANLEQLTITCTSSTGKGFINGAPAGTNGTGYVTELAITLANCTANLNCTVAEMMPAFPVGYWIIAMSTPNNTAYFAKIEALKVKTEMAAGGGCTQAGARELTGNAEGKFNNTTSELEFPAAALGGSTLTLGAGNATTLSGNYKITQTLEPGAAVTMAA